MKWWKTTGWPHLRALLLVVASAIAEKDPKKQLYDDIPIVLSASRIIVYIALFIWGSMGLAAAASTMPAWPFWTFGAILIIALPLLHALGKLAESDPSAILDFAKVVYSRLGVGDTHGDVYKTEEIQKSEQIQKERDVAEGIHPTPD